MTTSVTPERTTKIHPGSYVSVALLITMLGFVAAGALYVGRQLERIDTMDRSIASVDSGVSDLRREVQEIRIDLIKSGSIQPNPSRKN